MKYLIYILLIATLFFSNCKNTEPEENKNFDYANSIFFKIDIYDTLSGTFVFDTGAPMTVFDSTFVASKNLNLKKIDEIMVGGTSDADAVYKSIYANIPMSFLGNKIFSDDILVLDLKRLIPIEDGIIGLNFLQNRIVELNYEKEYIKILDNLDNISDDFVKIPIQIIDNQIMLELELHINDSIFVSGLFTIDTGSESTITLTRTVSDNLDLNSKIEKKIFKKNQFGGILGATKKYFFKAEKCQISGFEIENISASFSANNKGSIGSNETVKKGLIGNYLLEKFTIIFNLDDSEIFLKPNNYYFLDFEHLHSGLSIGFPNEKGYLITGIYENSSADSKNVNYGDYLLSIDDIDVKSYSFIDLRKLLKSKGIYKMKFSRKDSIYETEIEVSDILDLL